MGGKEVKNRNKLDRPEARKGEAPQEIGPWGKEGKKREGVPMGRRKNLKKLSLTKANLKITYLSKGGASGQEKIPQGKKRHKIRDDM